MISPPQKIKEKRKQKMNIIIKHTQRNFVHINMKAMCTICTSSTPRPNKNCEIIYFIMNILEKRIASELSILR